MLRTLCRALLTSALLALPAAADQSDRIVFTFTLKGLTAGQLSINGKIQGNSYGANGVMEAKGLLGALRTMRYDATVTGSYANGRFTPQRFDETAQRGSDRFQYVTIYKGGTPVSVSRVPPRSPRPTDVDPAQQGGTIDPLTALYAVLRDVDRDEACKLSVFMYDGSKRTQVSLSRPSPAGTGVTCAGEYRRIAGFSEREMKEKSLFPFTLTYAPTPDGTRLQVVSIETDTILGKGRLTRQ